MRVRQPRNKSNQGECCDNACIFLTEPKCFVLVQIRGDSIEDDEMREHNRIARYTRKNPYKKGRPKPAFFFLPFLGFLSNDTCFFR